MLKQYKPSNVIFNTKNILMRKNKLLYLFKIKFWYYNNWFKKNVLYLLNQNWYSRSNDYIINRKFRSISIHKDR